MSFQSGITNYQFYGNEFATMFDSSAQTLGWFDKVFETSSPPQFQPLVVDDDDSGGKVKPPSAEVVPNCDKNNKEVAEKKKKKEKILEAKAVAALKSHSEAERRRRQRINSHLDTLRGLLPSTEKVDKATLLADVIRQVKDLKKNATNATEGLVIPMDADAVKVEPQEEDDDANHDGTCRFKASICCDYRPELLSDLRQALAGLKLKTINAEISTFKGRALNVFILSSQTKQGTTTNNDDAKARRVYATSIQAALNTILDKSVIELDYSPRTKLVQEKKQKISFLDSSSSSS